ncbi:DUF4159 domain-containing protein [Oceanomicrobium pacificus]|uniref:DUF4159 domain-containing protein n=1 Tax=Oceanomicrobium pacificus TaxID=2692916 RepID=A0A6B0TUQ4_9RHOB|nr:DUF4159 domain-containing protein [Oceanomicrobium pacificus]MXU64972.1 DUF4159 domain-containing protein [Oceanomicrobium pacificus]
MLSLGPVAFLSPWLLAGLLALPVLWWLLRAVPPRPAERIFPGVRLLLGLNDPEVTPDRTPWWLLALRMLALAAAIIGFALPVLNPQEDTLADGPLLLLVDGGWASADDWPDRVARLEVAVDAAVSEGRPVALVHVAAGPPASGDLPLGEAEALRTRLAGLEPRPWAPDAAPVTDWLRGLPEDTPAFETLWLTDGLARDGIAPLAAELQRFGPVTMVGTGAQLRALTAPTLDGGMLSATVLRPEAGPEESRQVAIIGLDPTGTERRLATVTAAFAPGETEVAVALDLPVETRNRVSRLRLEGVTSAGAVALADDTLRRRKVGILSAAAAQEGQNLTDPLFYLRKALEPSADLIDGVLTDILNAAPDVLILADVGRLSAGEQVLISDWVEGGGKLVRFAGPRLAASQGGPGSVDPLLPVRLRAGGRDLGGALSWGAPKALRPFPETSPFAGLDVPADVSVSRQVVAQPDPDLAGKVMAALEDGTPLVTGTAMGDGQVILFHVTANAEWSNLPLSGLFLSMLERLSLTATGRRAAADLDGDTRIWTPEIVLDGFGALVPAGDLAGVPGTRLAGEPPAADAPPGLYSAGGQARAVNLLGDGAKLALQAPLPGVAYRGLGAAAQVSLMPYALLIALGTLFADLLASLALSGGLRRGGGRMAREGQAVAPLLIAGLAALALGRADMALAQSDSLSEADQAALLATSNTVLAYVATGDAQVDAVSAAGLLGLSRTLAYRTAVEPAAPVAVDPETDDLALYPFLYWPISEGQAQPSDAAAAKINTFLRTGGMILFDTRDAPLGNGFGAGGTPNGRVLQRIAQDLDIPPLEPVPQDHVLTRTFYLLQDFPGRHANAPVWIEAAPAARQIEGAPFRNLNDGVSPVVIGANDWASSWAIDADGLPLYPVGRGIGGERQREISFRFGVNLIMYVMTGNYKSDQVHVPALLERLGQ